MWLLGLSTAAQEDPLSIPVGRKKNSRSLYTSLSSSSSSTSTNWQGQDLRNFAFIGNVLYKHAVWDSTHSHAHQVLADLGYLKFADSL